MLSYICLAPIVISGAAGVVLLLGRGVIPQWIKEAVALVAWALALGSVVYIFFGPELPLLSLFVWQPMPDKSPGVGMMYLVDPLSRFFGLAGAIAAIFFVAGLRGRNRWTPGLIMANLALFFNSVFADDLLFLYISYELLGLGAYFLSLAESPTDAERHSFDMLVTYHVSGYGLLAAALLTGSQAGTFHISYLVSNLDPAQLPLLFLPLVGVTAVARTAQYPLHGWFGNTPPVVVPLQHSLQLLAGGYLLARALSMGGWSIAGGAGGLVAFGFISMMLLLFLAIVEADTRRSLSLLAASQVGFVFWGFGVASPMALAGALLQLLGVALSYGVAFIALDAFGRDAVARGRDLFRAHFWRAPPSMWLLLAAGASLVGVPSPTLGFASRLLVYRGGIEAGHVIHLVIAGVASAISLAAFLKVCRQAPLLVRMTSGHRGAGTPSVLVASAVLLLLIVLGIGGEAIVAGLQILGHPWTPGQGVSWPALGTSLLGLLGGMLLPMDGVRWPAVIGILDPLPLFNRLGRAIELGAQTFRKTMTLLESHPHIASILIASLFALFVVIE